jgi:hypothetical protein
LKHKVEVVPSLNDNLIFEFFLSQRHIRVLHEEIEQGLECRLEFKINLLDRLAVIKLNDLFVGFLLDLNGFLILLTDFLS